jgi:hypothetical protein
MSAADLLRQVASLGVRVSVHGDHLRFEGATARISPELRQALAACKAELLTYLAEVQPSDLPPTVRPAEITETTGNAEPDERAVVLERVRARISPRLRHWDDAMLVALCLWHLAVAFDRAGEPGWRRYLPAALAHLRDDEIAALVDWPILAALEQHSWPTDAGGAATLSRGGRRLATWWNARCARSEDGHVAATPNRP